MTNKDCGSRMLKEVYFLNACMAGLLESCCVNRGGLYLRDIGSVIVHCC